MPKALFVDLVPHALVARLLDHNASHPAEERIRLRMALHAGEVAYDEHGVTATSIIHAFRLLDATSLKNALAESPGVLALITSEWFFEEVVRHSHHTDARTFQPTVVVARGTSTTAWISRPDHPYAPDTGPSSANTGESAEPVPHQHDRITEPAAPLGRLVADTLAEDLEVRLTLPQGPGDTGSLPAYISREHDRILRERAAAAMDQDAPRSAVAVLVSDSTSGKTRALYEVLHHPVLPAAGRNARSLAEAGWRVWPSRSGLPAGRFLAELAEVGPRTVLWLNEAQRYLIEPGERTATAIAAGLRALVADSARGPVLLLGTLWPDYYAQITRSSGGAPDRYSHARALLANHVIPVPNVFTGDELTAARASTDTRVRAAITIADTAAGGPGRAVRVPLTQHMAGVPALLELTTIAATTDVAVLHAAMDARRLGLREWLPDALLRDAAPAYLDEHDQRSYLTHPDWFTKALRTLTTPLATAGACALQRPPVIPGRPPGDVVRLDDCLDQHGRRHRVDSMPPTGFWTAAAAHAHPGDLEDLGIAASMRGHYREAAQLRKNVIDHGHLDVIPGLVADLHDLDPSDPRPARWAMAATEHDLDTMERLLRAVPAIRADQQVAAMAKRAVGDSIGDAGDAATRLTVLHHVGAEEQIRELARRAAAGCPLLDPADVRRLLRTLRTVGADEQINEVLRRSPATHVALDNTVDVAKFLEELHELDAYEQVDELARRLTADDTFDDPGRTAHILKMLHDNEADADIDEQVDELTRRAVAHTPLEDALGLRRLLLILHTMGARHRINELLRRDPAAHVLLDEPWEQDPLAAGPWRVAALIETLGGIGAAKQSVELLRRALTHPTSHQPDGVARLLHAARAIGANEQFTHLAERAATTIAIDDLSGAGRLLLALHHAGADEHAAQFAERLAAQAALNEPDAVAWLISALGKVGADECIADLVRRDPATHAALDNPGAVAWLLGTLRELGETDQVARLIARDPAAHAALENLEAVAWLISELHDLGQEHQATQLAIRVAGRATPVQSDGVDLLLQQLRAMGADELITTLTQRLTAYGFYYFVSHELVDNQDQFQFGREPDGTAATPWSWDDLQ
ncbi:hypothetical protein GCM10027436_16070 [Actinophytocola sediminis]